MRNRYHGKCAQCLAPVGPGAGSAVRRGGRWVVLCAPHARTRPTPTAGRTAYRVREEFGGGWLATDDSTDAAVDAIRDGYVDY